LLRGVAWILFAIAGLAFLVGGRAFREFAHTDWLLAEMEGLGLTVVFAGLGAAVEMAAIKLSGDGQEDEV
jgi:hypothetical protein